MNTVTELRTMADRLIQIAGDERRDSDSRPNNPNALIRRASFILEDAVQELLEAAAQDLQIQIEPGSVRVLRERGVQI